MRIMSSAILRKRIMQILTAHAIFFLFPSESGVCHCQQDTKIRTAHSLIHLLWCPLPLRTQSETTSAVMNANGTHNVPSPFCDLHIVVVVILSLQYSFLCHEMK